MERERVTAEEEKRKAEQVMKDMEESHKNHMTRMRRDMEEQQAKVQKENEELLQKRLNEQSQLMKEGMEKKAAMMEEEITNLKKEMAEKKPDTTATTMETLSTVFKAALPFFEKIMDCRTASKISENKLTKYKIKHGLQTQPPTTEKNTNAG